MVDKTCLEKMKGIVVPILTPIDKEEKIDDDTVHAIKIVTRGQIARAGGVRNQGRRTGDSGVWQQRRILHGGRGRDAPRVGNHD